MLSSLLSVCEERPLDTGGYPSQKFGNVELWYFCCEPEQDIGETVELPVIWDSMALTWRHSNGKGSSKRRWITIFCFLTHCSTRNTAEEYPWLIWVSYQMRKIAGRECQERFPATERKSLVSDPRMHHGTCVTHVPWCMSASLNPCGGKMFPAFPAHA